MLDKVLKHIPLFVITFLIIQGVVLLILRIYPTLTYKLSAMIIFAPSLIFLMGIHSLFIWIVIHHFFQKNKSKKQNKMSLNVYISGKITGLPHAIALSKFKAAESMLFSENYVPINPMLLDHSTHNKTWESYMKVCIKELVCSDAIYMLNNYEESRGAKIELQLARDLGMKIMYEL